MTDFTPVTLSARLAAAGRCRRQRGHAAAQRTGSRPRTSSSSFPSRSAAAPTSWRASSTRSSPRRSWCRCRSRWSTSRAAAAPSASATWRRAARPIRTRSCWSTARRRSRRSSTRRRKTLTEVQPVMNVMLDDFVFFVKGDAPWKTAADFVKDAKAKPPKTYRLLHRRHHRRDGRHRARQGDRHGIEHGQLQQRRRGAHRAARRPRACLARQSARVHGPSEIRRGARDRRVPRQPLRRAAGRADDEGAGHQCADLPDVARRRDPEGRAGRSGADTGKA